MKILVTGSAGFIGSALSIELLNRGNQVIGIDNHNDYYDPKIKDDRLARHANHKNYSHHRIDIADQNSVKKCMGDHKPEIVVNLAAQAGVRYSLKNPFVYINSNLVGFCNILEGCRQNKVKHLVYASSSSVYGANALKPFSTHHNVDHPLSLYAATKKANELMAHTYSHLYDLPTTGLRLFTVYGPWDRPDMALQKFTKSILAEEKIKIYNYGKHSRDFTYVDDIVEGIIRILNSPAEPNSEWSGLDPDPASSESPWKIYNIGNNNPIEIFDYIRILEEFLGKTTEKELIPLQPGDVGDTFADIDDLEENFNFRPSTNIKEGIKKFVRWYQEYY